MPDSAYFEETPAEVTIYCQSPHYPEFGPCYECRDGLHERCIGVPCTCPCPTPPPAPEERTTPMTPAKILEDES